MRIKGSGYAYSHSVATPAQRHQHGFGVFKALRYFLPLAFATCLRPGTTGSSMPPLPCDGVPRWNCGRSRWFIDHGRPAPHSPALLQDRCPTGSRDLPRTCGLHGAGTSRRQSAGCAIIRNRSDYRGAWQFVRYWSGFPSGDIHDRKPLSEDIDLPGVFAAICPACKSARSMHKLLLCRNLFSIA